MRKQLQRSEVIPEGTKDGVTLTWPSADPLTQSQAVSAVEVESSEVPVYQSPVGTTAPLLMDDAMLIVGSGLQGSSPTESKFKLLTEEEFYPTVLRGTSPSHTPEEFSNRMAAEGMEVHKEPANLWLRDLQGGEVAFLTRDSEGQLRQHRGIIGQDKSQPNSALFTLDGNKEKFNLNELEGMAFSPKSSFADRHSSDKGWQNVVTSQRGWEMMNSAEYLSSHHISFRTEDSKGVMREWQGRPYSTHNPNNPYEMALPDHPDVFDIRKFDNLALKLGT